MKIKHQLLAASIAAVCTLSAQAQTTTSPGFYLGGSVGQSKWKGDTFPSLDTSSMGGKLYGGYEITPHFALELGYVDLGSFDYFGGSLEANGIFLDAVGKFPFSPTWSALLRAGTFRGKAETATASDTGTSFKLGAGVQYNLTPQASLRAEFERYRLDAFGDKPDTDLVSVGFNYRF